MNLVEIEKLSFAYHITDPEKPAADAVNGTQADEGGDEVLVKVFQDVSLSLPSGMVSFVGQNGTGKSTLMLLAGGRLKPDQGSVRLLGRDTRTLAPQEIMLLCSFVYQNMEFETEETVDELLEQVYDGGNLSGKYPGLIEELRKGLELHGLGARKTQELSKGELQRVILAFTLLYGSPLSMLDEPVFALEDHRKEQAFELVSGIASDLGTSIYFSAHEIELSKKYSKSMVLFHKSGLIEVGATAELCSREKIEQAYQVPWVLLKQKEHLHREHLLGRAKD